VKPVVVARDSDPFPGRRKKKKKKKFTQQTNETGKEKVR
jgi:hypothetical protein